MKVTALQNLLKEGVEILNAKGTCNNISWAKIPVEG